MRNLSRECARCRRRRGHVDGDDAQRTGGASCAPRPVREYLVVTVQDTGAGMSDDVRNQAFELFYRTKPSDVGSGIGLAQAKDAVRRSGGVVKIESTAGEGTTVTLAIPLASTS